MSARGHQGLLEASGSALAALIASLSPLTWLRLNDDTASSSVTDSAQSPAAGTLYSALDNASLANVNTSTRSALGLVSGDSDKCFDFGANTALDSPNRLISDATGWTAFLVVRPASAPSGGSATIFQFTSNPLGNGEPELGISDDGGGLFHLRVLLSGISIISMINTDIKYSYGDKLAIALKKEANGVIKEFVNGNLINTSTNAPSFNYSGGALRWGYGRFQSGAASNYYQFPGPMDELTLFNAPLSDATCEQLTASA